MDDVRSCRRPPTNSEERNTSAERNGLRDGNQAVASFMVDLLAHAGLDTVLRTYSTGVG